MCNSPSKVIKGSVVTMAILLPIPVVSNGTDTQIKCATTCMIHVDCYLVGSVAIWTPLLQCNHQTGLHVVRPSNNVWMIESSDNQGCSLICAFLQRLGQSVRIIKGQRVEVAL